MPTLVKRPVVYRKREKLPSIVLTSPEYLHFVEKKDASLKDEDKAPKRLSRVVNLKRARSKLWTK